MRVRIYRSESSEFEADMGGSLELSWPGVRPGRLFIAPRGLVTRVGLAMDGFILLTEVWVSTWGYGRRLRRAVRKLRRVAKQLAPLVPDRSGS